MATSFLTISQINSRSCIVCQGNRRNWSSWASQRSPECASSTRYGFKYLTRISFVVASLLSTSTRAYLNWGPFTVLLLVFFFCWHSAKLTVSGIRWVLGLSSNPIWLVILSWYQLQIRVLLLIVPLPVYNFTIETMLFKSSCWDLGPSWPWSHKYTCNSHGDLHQALVDVYQYALTLISFRIVFDIWTPLLFASFCFYFSSYSSSLQ